MKILQLGKFYPIRGGVEKVMWDLTMGLAERGHRCDMVCATLRRDPIDPDHFDYYRETPEGRVITMGPYGRVICVHAITKKAATMISPAMVKWVKKHCFEYDIIHIHHPDPMAALALRLSGYPGRVILHWHSDILSQKILLNFYRPLQTWLIRRAERIVGTTPVYLRESPVLRNYQDKTICVPIGIAPVIYDFSAVRDFSRSYQGKKVILGVGRLVPYKGFGTLIEAATMLGPDYMVVIVGSGPLYGELKQKVHDLHLEKKVLLLGYVQSWALPILFGACHIFAMSSDRKTEAFGIVQIEAMSCGKPVVATYIPQSGVSWVNKDGESGYNVHPNNPRDLALAIQKIDASPETYMRFSNNAMERYEALFTSREMIDKIIRIYENQD